MPFLKNKKIAVFGFGSQGQTQALNLRDNGHKVVIALRQKSPHLKLAQKSGFKVIDFAQATLENDVLVMLISDMAQPEVYEKYIKPNMLPGKALIFAHGFNIHAKTIKPEKNIDVILVAPKGGPGPMVRAYYEQKKGIPMLYAIQQNYSKNAKKIAEEYAYAIGGQPKLLIKSSFKEETEADLFGEQAIQCGGMSRLVLNGFETLVKAGFSPEVAYFETLHELKLVTDLAYKGGFSFMRKSISQTAQWGDYIAGDKVIDKQVRKNMEKVLKDIQSNLFAKNWIKEYQTGLKKFKKFQEKRESHAIEKVGNRLRKMLQK